MRSFHVFSLLCINLPSAFIDSVVSFLNNCKSTSFQDFSIFKHSLWDPKIIKWHRISKIRVVLWHVIPRYVFWCLDQRLYNSFPTYLWAYNIPALTSILAWYFVRKRGLVYIECRYVSFLPLLVWLFSVSRCNFYFAKFKTRYLCYIFLNPPYDFFGLA